MKSIKQMLAVFALTSLLATGALAGDTPCGVRASVNSKATASSGTSDLRSYVSSMLSYAAFLVFRF